MSKLSKLFAMIAFMVGLSFLALMGYCRWQEEKDLLAPFDPVEAAEEYEGIYEAVDRNYERALDQPSSSEDEGGSWWWWIFVIVGVIILCKCDDNGGLLGVAVLGWAFLPLFKK